ncbi:MAG: ImmA/IrrE family metallo-endopeptidase [Ruminococcus sp.]|nr:ImmA/IrrE family metallo-endopeptidase [Ruminococcus sp.]MDE7226303.1 ImmA/IrrE family metallo-endopeptidase [Ruminococcus sp.]
MNYNIYKYARDAAWKFLIESHVTSLPVKLSEICRQRGILLLYDYDGKYLSGGENGCTFTDDEKRFNIILNPDDSIELKRYTMAHELGHIFLDHLVNTTFSSSDMEYQAERFAINILAPACVLWGLDLHTAKDISEACNISEKAAQKRAERMAVLYRRNKFLTSPLEKQVFEQFKTFMLK